MLKSRRALMLSGAIAALAKPRLSDGAKIDFNGALDGVTAANISDRAAQVALDIVALVSPQLAQDQAIDAAEVQSIIDAVNEIAGDATEGDEIVAQDADPAMGSDGSDEDADDDDDEDEKARKAKAEKDKDKSMSKPAMDAAIAAAVEKVRADTIAEMNAIREAEAAVAPHIGTIKVAMDSAAAVYRLALDAAKVDLTGVPEAAYAAMVRMLPLPDAKRVAPRVAMDAAAEKGFRDRFPTASELVRS